LATPQNGVKVHGAHASPEYLSSEILSLLRLMQIEMVQCVGLDKIKKGDKLL